MMNSQKICVQELNYSFIAVLIIGVLTIVLGFGSLFFADARAENFMTFFGCTAVVSGYTLLGISIMLRR